MSSKIVFKACHAHSAAMALTSPPAQKALPPNPLSTSSRGRPSLPSFSDCHMRTNAQNSTTTNNFSSVKGRFRYSAASATKCCASPQCDQDHLLQVRSAIRTPSNCISFRDTLRRLPIPQGTYAVFSDEPISLSPPIRSRLALGYRGMDQHSLPAHRFDSIVKWNRLFSLSTPPDFQ